VLFSTCLYAGVSTNEESGLETCLVVGTTACIVANILAGVCIKFVPLSQQNLVSGCGKSVE